MHKPLSKQEREGLIGFIGGAIIRLAQGSQKEFEALNLKLERLRLDTRPDLDLLAYAVAAAWKAGTPSAFMENAFTGLYGVDSRDLTEAQDHALKLFPDGEFL